MTSNDGRAFAAEMEQATEPDPMKYWKPEVGDLLLGWVVAITEVPNNFYDSSKPQEGNNQPTQKVLLVVEDEVDEPILIYGSGAVLRRLIERGPSAGHVMRAPKVGDHIGIKRLEDEQPKVRGQKGMKQFYMRIDPEPGKMPALVGQTISQQDAAAREQKALGSAKPVANTSDEFANESLDDLDLPKGSTVVNGVITLPEEQTPF